MKIYFILIGVLTFFIAEAQQKVNSSSVQSDYSYQYALIEASRQKMIGNINEAVNLYLSCINSNPSCDVAYYELGTVYSSLNENVKAEDMLQKAYNINPKNYWYGIAYSELLKLNKKSSKSLDILKKIRKINEANSITIDFKISEILSDEHKFHKAIAVLDKIETKFGVSEIVSIKKFEIYKTQKNNVKADVTISDLIKNDPGNIDYLILKAEFYTQIGDSLKALQTYELAYKVDSSNIYAITNLADMYSSLGKDERAFYFLNQAFLNENIPLKNKIQTMIFLNKDRDMIRRKRNFIEGMVENLLREYPDNNEVSTVAYDFYNGLDEHEKALTIIKILLGKVKDDFIIWQQALYTASMLEDYDELIIIGEEGLKYFPNKEEFYLFVGIAYFQKQDYEKSYRILNMPFSAIKDDDKIKIQFLPFLAESAYRTNRKSESYRFFDQIIELDTTNELIKNNYSYYLALDSSNLLKAKDISYSTILSSPENSTYLDTYAWILFKLGSYELARKYSQKALLINGETDPDIIFHYAEILASLKEYELSEKYYKLSMEKGYDKDTINKKLKVVNGN